MPQICTTRFWIRALLFAIVSLPLPAMATSSFFPASSDNLSFFELGLIYGGVAIIAISNFSLFFRQLCRADLILLCFVLCALCLLLGQYSVVACAQYIECGLCN